MTKGRNKKRFSLITKILLGFNFLLIAALALSYTAPYVSPDITVIPAFSGLLYPVFLLLNLGFIFWWIFRRKWYFLLSLVAVLSGWGMLNKNISIGWPGSKQHPEQQSLKIISFNVCNFNVQNWHPGETPVTRDSIFSFLKRADAGIVCLQEFFHGEGDYFPTLGTLKNMLQTNYVHTDFVVSGNNSKHFGLATFSRYPMVNKEEIHFPKGFANSAIFSDIIAGRDTFRVFNLHLESIHFSSSDIRFVSELAEPGDKQNKTGGKVIFSKLSNAFKKRSRQAEIIAEYLRQSPYPVILCGDFNDTPSSFAYHTIITNDLSDAFSYPGFGKTFAGDIPFLRIDYILHDRDLVSFGYQRYKVNLSDHYPISCFVGW